MAILLGNLSIKEMEKRTGITFSTGLIDFMIPRRQDKAGPVNIGCWHCFDIPFSVVCGDRKTAEVIYRYLAPLTIEFKETLQIAIEE